MPVGQPKAPICAQHEGVDTFLTSSDRPSAKKCSDPALEPPRRVFGSTRLLGLRPRLHLPLPGTGFPNPTSFYRHAHGPQVTSKDAGDGSHGALPPDGKGKMGNQRPNEVVGWLVASWLAGWLVG